MKDNAQEWFTSLAVAPNRYHSAQHGTNVHGTDIVSFTHLFKEKFSTPKQKAIWQKQLFEVKQGTDTVDTYVSRFKQLYHRVNNPTAPLPAALVVQFFIQGLRPEYAINVQAAEPATLNAAITEARKWETGRVMATENNTNGDHNVQVMERLTEQLSKLNINLAVQQPTTPVYYSEANNNNNNNSSRRDNNKNP
jgi:hypothetical protein